MLGGKSDRLGANIKDFRQAKGDTPKLEKEERLTGRQTDRNKESQRVLNTGFSVVPWRGLITPERKGNVLP